jgi:hypothetical protein
MLNIAETLNRRCREARPFALATVACVCGSNLWPNGGVEVIDGPTPWDVRRCRRGSRP